jgi:hypothetical protein
MGCCAWQLPTLDPNWVAYRNDLLDAMNDAGCSNLWSTIPGPECGEFEISPPPSFTGECPDGYEYAREGVDYHLSIAPAGSYISITGPVDTLYESVSGVAALGVGPAEFLGGFFWIADSEYGGATFTDWVFTFRHPVDISVVGGGYYYVTAAEMDSAGAIGTGSWNGARAKLTLDASSPGVGHMSTATGAWTFNIEQSQGGDTIEIHLEGLATTQ